MWIGTAEVGKAIGISWKSKLVARTLADLTGRTTTVTNQGIANIFNAATAVFAPYDATQLSMRISSIKRISASQTQVIWSEVRSSPSAPTPPLDPKLPSGILDNVGDTIIYAETFYRYIPMTNWASADPGPSGYGGGGFLTLVGGAVPINYTYYMVPRLTEVARTP